MDYTNYNDTKKEKGTDNGDLQYNLGKIYYNGNLGVEIDYAKARDCFENSAQLGNALAQSCLGEMYLLGLGGEENFKKAEQFFKEAFQNGEPSALYYIMIFELIKGRKIQVINNISETIDDTAGAVLIKPEQNVYSQAHTLYDIATIKKIKTRVNSFFSDIPETGNEFDVFKRICEKMSKISYDEDAVGFKAKKLYTSRNLIGALLQGQCVCSGYAETLRNLCESRGIECIFISSQRHAFNQVKIGQNWYYIDMTDYIREGGSIESSLKCEKDFCSIHQPMKNQITHPSDHNYCSRLEAPIHGEEDPYCR